MIQSVNYELLFKSLLGKFHSDVIVIDSEGQILIWGSGLTEVESAPQDVIGKHLLDVYPHLSSQDGKINWELEIFTHVLKEGRPIEVRRQSRQTGKKTLWFDVMVYPLKDQEEIIGAAIVIIDISERHSLEETLTRQARTQSLANLGASIAHEIRNPLNAMALNIQLVREGIKNPEKEKSSEHIQNLNLILEEIERLDSIVKNFLQFARPPQTTLSLDSPNKAVEAVASMLKEQARKKGIELKTTCRKIPDVLMDRNRLVEAVFNITQNAVQALSKGGTIELSTRFEEDSVIIDIQDDGPGIPRDMQDKIFELYFSTKEEGHGTGLGLPYADSLIKSHNGHLTLHSEVGKGATFSIRLPRSIITGTQS